MDKSKHIIMAIHIQDRLKQAPEVQKILTAYGCNIKTRLGLHEVSGESCATNGLLILEMVGDEGKCNQMADKLRGFDGVDVQKMVFEHN